MKMLKKIKNKLIIDELLQQTPATLMFLFAFCVLIFSQVLAHIMYLLCLFLLPQFPVSL